MSLQGDEKQKRRRGRGGGGQGVCGLRALADNLALNFPLTCDHQATD
jgi:hypothetical protein